MKYFFFLQVLLINIVASADIDNLTVIPKVKAVDKKTVTIEYRGKKKILSREALPKDARFVAGEPIVLTLTPEEYDELVK